MLPGAIVRSLALCLNPQVVVVAGFQLAVPDLPGPCEAPLEKLRSALPLAPSETHEAGTNRTRRLAGIVTGCPCRVPPR